MTKNASSQEPWWRRLPPWKQMVLAFGVLLLGLFAYTAWDRYGWHPDLVVHGRIIEHESGGAIPGTYVILDLIASRATSAHGVSSCSKGSAVVRSDSKGNFSYRVAASDALRKPYPDSWGFTVWAYHPEFESVASPHGSAQPLYYRGGDAVLEMRARQATQWEHLQWISGVVTQSCFLMNIDHGHSQMSKSLYEQAWRAYCENDQTNDAIRLEDVMSFLEARLREIARHTLVELTDDQRSELAHARTSHVTRRLAGNYPRNGSNPSGWVEPTSAERSAFFCSFYAPPADRALRQEFSL